jgi:hypothetical protein
LMSICFFIDLLSKKSYFLFTFLFFLFFFLILLFCFLIFVFCWSSSLGLCKIFGHIIRTGRIAICVQKRCVGAVLAILPSTQLV